MLQTSKKILSGKVAIITGCSKGIGKVMTEVFAGNGAAVYPIARTQGCIDEYAESLNVKFNNAVKPLYFDINDQEAAKKAFLSVYKENNKIDILVNNAGIMKDALIGMISNQMLTEMFQTNVFALIQLTQLVTKFMLRQNTGSIINIASIIGINGNAGQSVYSATKGAVITFTKSASKELSPRKIRVNAIAPGIIDTELIATVPKELMTQRISNIKMGRIGTPYDVSNLALFLASDFSDYITGQVIAVDGGAII